MLSRRKRPRRWWGFSGTRRARTATEWSPCRRRTMESVPAPRSRLRSGSTRWSCTPGTATRVSSMVGGGGAASSSFVSGNRFSASSSGLTVGYSEDEGAAVPWAARKAVLWSGWDCSTCGYMLCWEAMADSLASLLCCSVLFFSVDRELFSRRMKVWRGKWQGSIFNTEEGSGEGDGGFAVAVRDAAQIPLFVSCCREPAAVAYAAPGFALPRRGTWVDTELAVTLDPGNGERGKKTLEERNWEQSGGDA
ncbi:hypothetical protein PR202_gb19196 [Eleusine coracana subsp. coracana]|uniref:Uncharacterized protein n=1 Tax=Eleusine coracana subsp. coracana TaxID=191504 RepID=A0AAV5F7L6_ELECO|nr:hypothetical protein PR202_gb19196 [Eleusine coracana subsp. coracana]